ncbi:hypothetical protein PGTUg99_002407 [Puccinia graminis f. sp. tritici]|uniref:Tyr recombinase domain-containing protein n=1 Tax=Puccinia graminis f. sp. tritici TaxID=56615 RepID=A0A5B0S9K9_PUCGR|nr:hypothetical protein PGTUg99_002407 [Puccinia graminis f. sp. tritici]
MPVMLWHMTHLWATLSGGDDFDKAVLDLFIVAFWGLARLAELTYSSRTGEIAFAESVLSTDVFFTTCERGEAVTLTVRNAKTGAPGAPQIITLGEQRHALCPVLAIRRRISATEGKHTYLFGSNTVDGRQHVTRREAVTRLGEVLSLGDYHGLRGHSFRVGGASLRAALGMSAGDLSQKRTLLRTLRGNWKKMDL